MVRRRPLQSALQPRCRLSSSTRGYPERNAISPLLLLLYSDDVEQILHIHFINSNVRVNSMDIQILISKNLLLSWTDGRKEPPKQGSCEGDEVECCGKFILVLLRYPKLYCS